MSPKTKALVVTGLAYSSALAVAVLSAFHFKELHPFIVILRADIAATLVIFCFSFTLNNSSINDSYWSLVPVVIIFYYIFHSEAREISYLRSMLLTVFVCFWGTRLTYFVLYYWRGLDHEDWRYVDLRKKTGKLYWLASFWGLHILPMVLVYLASLSFCPVMMDAIQPFGLLDVTGAVIVITGLVIGAISDEQLRKFRKEHGKTDKILRSGLWASSRHPNYLGEILYWWGIYFMGLAANPAWWWTIIGPVGITALFVFISVDLMDEHMRKKSVEYEAYIKNVPGLIPRSTVYSRN